MKCGKLLLCSILCLLLVACEPQANQQKSAEVKKTMTEDVDKPEYPDSKPQKQEVLAQLITYGGHGKLFDKDLNEIILDDELVDAIQDSMIEELSKQVNEKKIADSLGVIKEAQKLLTTKDITVVEANLIKNGIIGILLEGSSEKLIDLYHWRYNIILGRSRNIYLPTIADLVRPRIVDLLEHLRLFDFLRDLVLVRESNYIRDCRAHSVPIPPDWEETGTAWVKHGQLTTNLLEKGRFAEVWSYSDPNVRGGCIALPRGSGAAGSALGIICQSATTGHACFWDNIKLGETRAFGWKNKRVVISQIQDGSNLNLNCTGCHQGNNVFIVAPDDNVWGEVLGRVASPNLGANFTMQVDNSTDNREGRPRYIPISTLPIRTNWENKFMPNQANDCAQSCHEKSAWTVRNGISSPANLPNGREQVPLMTPLCSRGPAGVAGCY